MDPTNINPNENQTAAMPEMPTPVNPVINPGESAASPTSPVAPEFAATPAPAEAPAMPETPTFSTIPETPAAAPVAPAAPLTPEAVAAPVMPDIPEPVNPVYTPGDNVMVGETDPITVPNPPKAPDPIEEELKAPMQAAAPVPGSIGSAISMHWRRKWQPTLVFLPRECQGQGSLVGCRLWGRTESDTTEAT